MDNDKQAILNIMMEVLMMVHNHESFNGKDNEYVAEYAREQLKQCGFPTEPMGMSWAVLSD